MFKKNVLITLIVCSLILCLNTITVYCNDNLELNWYYCPSKDNIPPMPPKESTDFLASYNGYYLGDTSKKILYLTFDEGYENGNTLQILDVLKELDIPAAFFVVKPYIKANPNIILRMVDEKHLVCNHSNHHPSMPAITDETKFENELLSVEESFKDLTKLNMPKFFRPPMGKYSKNSLAKTKDLGYKSIFWSFAYKDWLIDNQPSEDFAIKKIIFILVEYCFFMPYQIQIQKY